MINVSFHDVMVGNELPAPRTAARSDAESAFATLMDEATSRREEAPVKDVARERVTERRETRSMSARTTADSKTAQREPSQFETRNAADRPKPTEALKEARGAETDSGDKNRPEELRKPAPGQSTVAAGTGETDEPTNVVPAAVVATSADQVTPITDSNPALDQAIVALSEAAQPVQTNAVPVIQTLLGAPQGDAVVAPSGPTTPHATSAAQPITGAPSHDPGAAGVAPATDVPVDVLNTRVGTPVPTTETMSTAVASPAPSDKPTTSTLFAATLLAQQSTDSGTAPQIKVATIPTPAADGAPADPTTTAAPARSTAHHDAPPSVRPAGTHAPFVLATSQSSTTAPSYAVSGMQLTPGALGLPGIDPITVEVAETPAPTKPVPPLANGMVAQLNATQPTDGQKTLSNAPSVATTPTYGLVTSGGTPPQTATAIATAPVPQPVSDELQPKVATPADTMVLNAPAPSSAMHAGHGSAAQQLAAAKVPAMPTPPVADQVAVHIAKAAADGSDKINIKLKPASLGQIEVQLDVAPDGRVHAVIAADKPETFDLLQRDARGLERALNDAGLRTDSDSLSFNLRGQGQQYGHSGNQSAFAAYGRAPERAGSDIALLAEVARIGAYVNSRAAAGGVDIRV